MFGPDMIRAGSTKTRKTFCSNIFTLVFESWNTFFFAGLLFITIPTKAEAVFFIVFTRQVCFTFYWGIFHQL